jgi:pimeloyl-ACP methyl ester carboxylesterase
VRRLVWTAALALVVLAAGVAAAPWVAGARTLVTLTDRPAWATRWAYDPSGVTWRDVHVATRYGAVAARVYRPARTPRMTLAVFPGVHGGGVDEPRMHALVTRLAASGALAVSVPVPDLRAYRLTARSTDVIEDATRWVLDGGLSTDGRVGLVGISFAGGLTVVAAGRESIRDRISAVVSLGGHGDLPRVIEYLCTARLPDGASREPHDYGLAVLTLDAVPHLVPADQQPALDRAIVTFLDASSAQGTDPEHAARLFAEARSLGDALPAPARDIMRDVIGRDTGAMGRRLLPVAAELGQAAALSPERSPAPTAPVFLLHGAGDAVIPESESVALAGHLRHSRAREVHALITPLLRHADVEAAVRAGDAIRLVGFWRDWLAAVR